MIVFVPATDLPGQVGQRMCFLASRHAVEMQSVQWVDHHLAIPPKVHTQSCGTALYQAVLSGLWRQSCAIISIRAVTE